MHSQIEVARISASVSVSAPNVDKLALSADIRFRPKAVVYHIRCALGFGKLQLVNSVVAESRVGLRSLSCGGRECARHRESLALQSLYILTDM